MLAFAVLLILVVVFLLAAVQFFFSSNSFLDPQLSVLEAGYESLRLGSSLSSSFFSLVALFVFFDLELIFLMPGVFSSVFLFLALWKLVLMVIILTLILEWIWYGLKWQV